MYDSDQIKINFDSSKIYKLQIKSEAELKLLKSFSNLRTLKIDNKRYCKLSFPNMNELTSLTYNIINSDLDKELVTSLFEYCLKSQSLRKFYIGG